MSETEKLLTDATEIAKRAFIDPTEEAVLAIFQRICLENDESRFQAAGVSLH